MSTTAAIREAATNADVALARELFVEYAHWLKVDLCFQGFDEELASAARRVRAAARAPAARRRARRSVRLHRAAACSRKPTAAPAVGEVKRLYVQPAARGGGWGRRLADALIADARAIGYSELKLDTLDWMDDARGLYARVGFRECAPYYRNPLPGAVYMSLAL